MSQGGAAHSGRSLRRWSTALVLIVLVVAFATYWFDLGTRWFGFDYPSPVPEPVKVAPPPGLTIPPAGSAAPVARPVPEGAVSGAAVRRAVSPVLRNKKLGRRVALEVAQVSDGRTVFRQGPTSVTPASTMKLLTTTAAMRAIGADHRFATTTVALPSSRTVVLVGGGDPLLVSGPQPQGTYPARADLRTLARSTSRVLRQEGRARVRLGYDTSLFTGPSVNPRWPRTYLRDNVVSPITPLWVDEGRMRTGLAERSPDPARAAADAFATALRGTGIQVLGAPRPQPAPAGAKRLAAVRSAPLGQVVQHVLEVSDNEGAEVLARQTAIARGRPASFDGGSRAVRGVLAALGVSTQGDRIFDGSGLSRDDRLHPATLMGVLEVASSADHPGLRPVVADLPVAGFTGSLAYRFQTGAAAGLGRVRAKTGTLTGVHGLAGTVTSVDGSVMAFVAVADRVRRVNTLPARAALDDVAAALARCRCAAPEPSASATP